MAFVEMLESIGRVAEVKFRHTAQEGEPLHRKIEYIIDELFSKYGLTRKEVQIEEVFSSSSEEES